MQNFIFKNPTEIIFGRGAIPKIASRIPADGVILLAYGGGSIKRNGVYDQVRAALKGRRLVEFSGIEPNPLYETCLKAVELVRQEDIRFILAVGGGSVIDASKFVAAAALLESRDPWEILLSGGANVQSALPVGVVLTLPATGSEMNSGSVISRRSTQEKLFFTSRHTFPIFSVLDPEATFSLSVRQVRNGIVDAFVHAAEQYVTSPCAAPLQDRLAESILQTLVEVGPKTLAQPTDYDSRASFMWCATLALNGLIGAGVPQDWATHMIGHELTAFYGLDHGQSLAVVLPGVWRHAFEAKKAKLAQYGRQVFNEPDPEAAIKRTEKFFHSLGMATRLSDYKVDAEDAAQRISARLAQRGFVYGEHQNIGPEAVAGILRSRA